MTTTVNTSNSDTHITNNLLDSRKIFPILEEVTTERTSDIAVGTLQQQLSLVLQNQNQLSTELKQLSLKLSLILQNQDQLSKKLKQLIVPCPPPPPPLPPSKISLKDQENSKEISPSLQTSTTLSTGNLRRSQSLYIKTSKKLIATEQQITEGLKNLRSPKNGNETNLSLQTSTAPVLEAKPSPLIENFSQSQLKRVENKQDENDKKPEIKETTSFATIVERFSILSQEPK